MPVKPSFEWEQTPEEVFLRITVKGVRKGAVDVFVSDCFAKVNAPPSYLLTLDLLHNVDPEACTHYADAKDPSLLHLRLRKAEVGLVWDALCVNARAIGKRELMARRAGSMQRAQELYNRKLVARGAQRETEKRRMTEAQWAVERGQRKVIEQRFQAERAAAEEDLYAWEDEATAGAARQASAAVAVPQSPADLFTGVVQSPTSSPDRMTGEKKRDTTSNDAATNTIAPVREAETVNVTVDFTPKMFAMPTRARGDEEYYRQSRYKPVSVEDSPMFWKERADAFYKSKDWRAAANAYSESIKRDGVFLTCVANRAACYLHLAEFKKAVDDCTLSLTMLANTPASEMTQERYRALMTKLHARRGAAYCWGEDLVKGLADLKMAAAYRDPTSDDDILADVATVEKTLAAKGGSEHAAAAVNGADQRQAEEERRLAACMIEASSFYYKGDFVAATEVYVAILAANPFHAQARSNLSAALLQQGRFKDALRECERVVEFCAEVAEALNQPGGLLSNEVDSDDDEDVEKEEEAMRAGDGDDWLGTASERAAAADAARNRDEMTRQRRAAARRISESSGHVYLLLKAYVRASAALSGLNDYRGSHAYLERALRITPYDNDLMDDCNRLAEKIRMDTLIAATSATRA